MQRDLDDQETKLPETQEEILDFLHALEQPPSIIVTSGNGVHTYWLLERDPETSCEIIRLLLARE